MHSKFEQNTIIFTVITKIIIKHEDFITLFKNNEVFC